MKKIFIYSLITLLLIPLTIKTADARNDTYTLLEPLPCIDGTESEKSASCAKNNTVTDMPLEDYIGYVFKFAIALAAFLAVIMIIWGGFEYMTTEAITGKSDARKRIQDALTGLLMVLASYLILRTIDPRLVEINTSIPKIVIKTDDVSNFLGALDQSLAEIANDERAKINALEDKIVANNYKIEELEKKGLNLTSEEFIELENLKQKNADHKKEQAIVLTGGTAANQMRLIVNYVDNATAKASIDKMNNIYDKAIAGLDPQRNAEEINDLKTRKSFFGEQGEFQRNLDANGTVVYKSYAIGGSGGSEIINNTPYLKEKLTNYTARLENNKNSSINDRTYTELLNTRIEQINKVLAPKTPPKP